jgi:hypothetical protein
MDGKRPMEIAQRLTAGVVTTYAILTKSNWG